MQLEFACQEMLAACPFPQVNNNDSGGFKPTIIGIILLLTTSFANLLLRVLISSSFILKRLLTIRLPKPRSHLHATKGSHFAWILKPTYDWAEGIPNSLQFAAAYDISCFTVT